MDETNETNEANEAGMAIEVEERLCIAAGRCVAVAPELFDVDEDGFVVLLEESPSESQREAAHMASVLCPAKAIRVIEREPE